MRRLENSVTAGSIELREPASVKGTYKRWYSSLDGQRHCADVCGHVRRRTVDGPGHIRLQQTRQLKKRRAGCPAILLFLPNPRFS